MFKLFKYLKGYVLQSILGPLFKMTEATFELIVPVVMAKIIDEGIKNGENMKPFRQLHFPRSSESRGGFTPDI